MSYWTYVRGVMRLDTVSRSTPEAMYIAQTVVRNLPRITGSEGDTQYYYNIQNGHQASSNADEFCRLSNLYDDPYYKLFHTQSNVLVTIDGALRDRFFDQTLRETVRMLARLAPRTGLVDLIVTVEGWDKTGKPRKAILDNTSLKWLNQLAKNPDDDWSRKLLKEREY